MERCLLAEVAQGQVSICPQELLNHLLNPPHKKPETPQKNVKRRCVVSVSKRTVVAHFSVNTLWLGVF